MLIIKNGQISPQCHFNEIIKGPGTSFQSLFTCQTCLSYKTLVFDQISFWQCLGFKINKHKCNLHYVTMPMLTSQILNSADFTKRQKSRYLENETKPKNIIFLKNHELHIKGYFTAKNSFVVEVTLKYFSNFLYLTRYLITFFFIFLKRLLNILIHEKLQN